MTGYGQRLDHTLQWLNEIAPDFQTTVLANGFGPENMVLTAPIAAHQLDIDIFSLDTGGLPEQTRVLARSVRKRYGLTISMLSPDHVEMETGMARHGTNAFHESPAAERVLRDQEVNPLPAHVPASGLGCPACAGSTPLACAAPCLRGTVRINFTSSTSCSTGPTWTHNRDYPVTSVSTRRRLAIIGCAPCTRAIVLGEDVRAGRCSWGREGIRDCGLHIDTVASRLARASATNALAPGVAVDAQAAAADTDSRHGCRWQVTHQAPHPTMKHKGDRR